MTQTQDQARAVEVEIVRSMLRRFARNKGRGGYPDSVEITAVHALLTDHTTRGETIAKQADEIEALRLAICGGEDAPGYAMSLPLDVVLDVARQNTARWFGEADRAIAAEAKLVESEAREEALRDALKDIDAMPGYVEPVPPEWVGGLVKRYHRALEIAALTLKGRS